MAPEVPSDWLRFKRPDFGLAFSYPAVTPDGSPVERTEDARGDTERVHVRSSDRRELYIEIMRFRQLAPQGEYEQHRPYLEQRFGDGSVSALIQTTFGERPASRYDFGGPEGEGELERSVILLEGASDTYRIIYDPRSELNDRVLATITLTDG
jgi:hypothetical protein